jgi:alkaline phosphatase D
MRSQDYLQPLLAATAHYATWDDHDYGPNNSDRSYVHKATTLEAFNDYWLNPTAGLPGVPGVFTHFEIGDAHFFLLDDRWYRAPADIPPGAGNDMLGEAQVQWLLDALAGSRAPFKLVAVGSQVLNESSRYESFANHPAERQRLLDGIRERDVHGVVFLTGDRHHTELLRLDREGTYSLYDFTSSPLTSGAGTARGAEADNPLRVPGTLVGGQRNFGTLTFTGPRTDRTLTMRTFSNTGDLLWEHAVRARDLRPGE